MALDRIAASVYPDWGGRCVDPATLHLTLAFLGDTPVVRLDALRELAAGVSGDAFTLTLDQPGCWPHNRVGWLGPTVAPPALMQLVEQLRQAMRTGKFTFDERRFTPHVTLIRNARCSPSPPCEPVTWQAYNFVLLASRIPQRGYEVLGTWPLN